MDDGGGILAHGDQGVGGSEDGAGNLVGMDGDESKAEEFLGEGEAGGFESGGKQVVSFVDDDPVRTARSCATA